MGKLLTVKAGYSGVLLPNRTGNAYNATVSPQVPGWRNYNAGDTVTVTDAEYALFNAATTAAVTVTTSGLADPYRVIASPASTKEFVKTAVTGAGPWVATLGTNFWTVTGALITNAITVAANNNTTGVVGAQPGNAASLAFYFTYTTTSGLGTTSTLFPTATWKWAGGAAPTWSTTATYVDYVRFVSSNGGTTWLEVDRSIGIH